MVHAFDRDSKCGGRDGCATECWQHPPPAAVAPLRAATSPTRGEVGRVGVLASLAGGDDTQTTTSPLVGEVGSSGEATEPGGGGHSADIQKHT